MCVCVHEIVTSFKNIFATYGFDFFILDLENEFDEIHKIEIFFHDNENKN